MSGYTEEYYREHPAGEYTRNHHWLRHFDMVARSIIRQRNPTTVFDAGCALGILVERLREHGVSAWGCDLSDYAITQARADIAPYLRVASITQPLKRRYDIITCIEVVEHCPENVAVAGIANLCQHTDVFLFSSSPDDTRDETHINLHGPDYWRALFEFNGFEEDAQITATWLVPWARWYVRLEN